MKKVLVGMALFLSVGVANAGGAAGVTAAGNFAGAFVPVGIAVGLGYLAAQPKEACYNEPVRNVRMVGKGYDVDLAGCDYQTKKDKVIRINKTF